ncbi:nitrate reductase cytochrome c-type subunit [Dyella sp. LX-66]|uniref:nitrate reductase cytochrome c-type subunit n=1 Tax=unclassified Dyella TaxID=2634549 RepID=UPI001BDFBF17|nr:MULTISPECIES: nitrate reductase cytochrome c-type subunit [unclassified Dyella]MBT2116552.1 nitrate reductase cytochrome c-type subunit [Dyella sp. LX-1]MBT2140505.1 nitrate reductase cytochrome c-type subunit [Dyella sp. LX-66]
MSNTSRFAASAIVVLALASALAFVATHRRVGPTGEQQAAAPAAEAPVAAPRPAVAVVPAGAGLDAIRRGAEIDKEIAPAPMARVENTDIRRNRAYPMQPPTIPHTIDNYQIDRNSNRCMLCHARANADKFQAPPVSVTHYMDRDDQFLATISPRRYFCNQCHVVQTDAQPLVANGFKDIDTVLSEQKAN